MAIRLNGILIFLIQFFLLMNCGSRHEKSNGDETSNNLGQSSSPYLREHADNPVNWHEWGPEALDKAKKENKLLIISIGYSSCHWCHVMEEETFMDTAVARIMNENFISIKVDREERPDIDQIYLEAAQLISGNSGWPLNAFALPDGKPFYAGTYFPKLQWITMLRQIIKTYKEENANVLKQADALTKALQDTGALSTKGPGELSQTTYDSIFQKWQPSFDFKAGGLAGAPKFPMPVIWEFLLQNYYLTNNSKALEIVTTTLNEIAKGGIYDHLGGGFARYTTDAYWKIPHFEKMLYDNAQLVSLYAHAFQVTKSKRYRDVVTQTLAFVQREMMSPEGGFWASINADSEGEEGRYYSWTKSEIQNSLDKEKADLFADYYQVVDSGNWENGKNILYATMSKREFALNKKIKEQDCDRILGEAETELFTLRNSRIRPSTDTKILLSWNALMLKGFVDAYLALGESVYLQVALTNARFLEKHMIQNDGRLWRNYANGKATTEAFLDDYALLARSFVHLYQATFDIHWLEMTQLVLRYAVTHFRNSHSDLFYYTADEADNLVVRKMELADNVIPSSNAVLAEAMYMVGQYYGQDSLVAMSTAMLRHVASELTTDLPYYGHWASFLGLVAYQPYEVAVMGNQSLDATRKMQIYYLPTTFFMGGSVENLPLLENKGVSKGTMIYVCRNKTCKLPQQDVALAMKQLLVREAPL
ncbi:MAG TPA: thioredoxin domain-containing protein [Chryseolinea sp.]